MEFKEKVCWFVSFGGSGGFMGLDVFCLVFCFFLLFLNGFLVSQN